jgi:hypothetical protein
MRKGLFFSFSILALAGIGVVPIYHAATGVDPKAADVEPIGPPVPDHIAKSHRLRHGHSNVASAVDAGASYQPAAAVRTASTEPAALATHHTVASHRAHPKVVTEASQLQGPRLDPERPRARRVGHDAVRAARQRDRINDHPQEM